MGFFSSQICLAIGLTTARRDNDRTHWKKIDRKDFHGEKKFTEFCSNSSIADGYRTRVLILIKELQGNAAYQPILISQWGNFIKYIEEPANGELLQKNCVEFIQGLKAAKEADRDVIMQQRKLANTVAKQMKEAMFNLNDGKELDI